MENYGCYDNDIPHGVVDTFSCRHYYSTGIHFCNFYCFPGYTKSTSYVYCGGGWKPSNASLTNPCIPEVTSVPSKVPTPEWRPRTTSTPRPFPLLSTTTTTRSQPSTEPLRGYYGDLPDLNVSPGVYAGAIFGGLFLVVLIVSLVFIRLYRRKLSGDHIQSATYASQTYTTEPVNDNNQTTILNEAYAPPAYEAIHETPPAYDQISTVNNSTNNTFDKGDKTEDLPPAYTECIKNNGQFYSAANLDSNTSVNLDSNTTSNLDSNTTADLDSSICANLDSTMCAIRDRNTSANLDSDTSVNRDSNICAIQDSNTREHGDSSTCANLDNDTSRNAIYV